MSVLLMVLMLSAAQQSAPADTALDVQPGEAAIKDKDLYDATGYVHPFRRMPRFVLVDQKKIWTSPFHTSKDDAKWWAIWGGTVGGLIVADRYIQRNEPSNATWARVGNDASKFGQAYTLLPLAAGFYFIGTAKSKDRLREAGMLSFEAVADVSIVQLVLKSALGRERPLDGHHNGAFEQSPSRVSSSFPSGHTITTFAMGSILAHEYPRKWWIKALIYGYGGGVAAARLAANKHFPSDVVAGGVMGWFVGDYVYGKRHNADIDEKPTALRTILSHIQFGG
jgi:membrane-associated phospholipid phosphatase